MYQNPSRTACPYFHSKNVKYEYVFENVNCSFVDQKEFSFFYASSPVQPITSEKKDGAQGQNVGVVDTLIHGDHLALSKVISIEYNE